jgi:hypothetical protein
MYCTKHNLFYRFGRCPKCLETEVKGKTYAAQASVDGRWQALQANPTALNQDQFGICGMSSVVYLLLNYKSTRAQELFEATFADLFYNGRQFSIAGHAPISIPFRYLARRYRLMEQSMEQEAPQKADQWVKNKAAYYLTQGYLQKDVTAWETDVRKPSKFVPIVQHFELSNLYFADFCVSRGLGYVFKTVAKSRYESEKKQFNLEFSETIPMYYQEVTHLGNFALRTNNLAYILANIIGANVHIACKTGANTTVKLAKDAGVPTSTFTTGDDLLKKFKKHFTAPGKFAVAAVFGDICKQGDHVSNDSPAGTKPGLRLAYNHWVVIKNFSKSGAIGTTCTKNHADLQIWTWAKDYSIQVCEGNLPSYIQDVIFGEFT